MEKNRMTAVKRLGFALTKREIDAGQSDGAVRKDELNEPKPEPGSVKHENPCPEGQIYNVDTGNCMDDPNPKEHKIIKMQVLDPEEAQSNSHTILYMQVYDPVPPTGKTYIPMKSTSSSNWLRRQHLKRRNHTP